MTTAILAAALYIGYPLPPAERQVRDGADAAASRTAPAIERYATADDVPGGVTAARWKTDWILLRRIEPTTQPVTLGRKTRVEDTRRRVEITKPYYIAVYETTRAQWARLSGVAEESDGTAESPVKPVGHVSYNQVAQALEGTRLTLPTEAQWEYASRAGTTGPWNNGEEPVPYALTNWNRMVKGDRTLDKLGRYAMNGGMVPNGNLGREPTGDELKTYGPAPVGSYQPNAWGLYDMHGNVYELCRDWHTAKPTAASAGCDPEGPAENPEKAQGLAFRVIKGGSWWNYLYGSPELCKSGERSFGGLVFCWIGHGAVGFRVMLSDRAVGESNSSGRSGF